MQRLQDDQDRRRQGADCEDYGNQDKNLKRLLNKHQNMLATGGGLDSSVDIVVSDKVSAQFYHKWQHVCGHCHSQSVPWGPLVRIARHEENTHAEDD